MWSVYSDLGAVYHGSFASTQEALDNCKGIAYQSTTGDVVFITDEHGEFLTGYCKENETIFMVNDYQMSRTMVIVEDSIGYPLIKVFYTGHETMNMLREEHAIEKYIGMEFMDNETLYIITDIKLNMKLPREDSIPHIQEPFISDYFFRSLDEQDEEPMFRDSLTS